MGRSKKPLPLLENVTIEAVAAEGKCLLHWNDLVVFVPWCVPGDVCDVQLRRKKHSFAEGEVVRFIKYSDVRATPFCQHFGVCGGCKWQNLPYEEQLRFKQQQVYDQLSRIGKIELPPFQPILGSVKTTEYRNKLDFGCANKRYLTKEQFAAEESRIKNDATEEQFAAEESRIKSEGVAEQFAAEESRIKTEGVAEQFAAEESRIKSEGVAEQFATEESRIKTEGVAEQFAAEESRIKSEGVAEQFAAEESRIKSDATEEQFATEESRIKSEGVAEANSSFFILHSSLKDLPAIGFHITGAFDKILPIEKCWLMDDLHNTIRNEIRDYALQHAITFFDLRQQVGLLRDIIIRNSASGELMVIIQFHYDATGGEQEAMALLQHVADTFPQITSLMYLDNQKCNDTIGDQDVLLFKGQDHIFELMEDLKFKVGPKSFYQTNTEQAYHLYCVARQFAFMQTNNPLPLRGGDGGGLGASSGPLVYDLYTGTGTIANFVARHARQVIGIEYVPEAIEDAKINSELNGIHNTLFFAGDMKDILTDDFIARHGRPDVIITDPPRAGMHPDVVKTILRAAPQRIVYVSCNPATQARDLHDMDADYRVAAVQPVDMFPHTPHVENVVLLVRR